MNPSPSPITSPLWSPTAKRTVALLVLVLAAWFMLQVADALPLLVIAGVLAFLFNPLTNVLERALGGRRSLAILLTFIIVLLLLIVAVLVVVPTLFEQVAEFTRTLPARVATLQTSLEASLGQPLTVGGRIVMFEGRPLIPLDQLREVFGTPEGSDPLGGVDLIGTLQAAAASVGGRVFLLVGGAFSTFLNLFLLLVIIFYLLKDGRRFVQNTVGIVPASHQGDARRLFTALTDVWNAYLRGQITLCLLIGGIVFAAALILGVPNPLVLGLLSGALEFIPTLGPLIALVPAALLALASQSATLPFLSGVPFAIVVIVVWTLIQNLEALIIVPRVMGDSLDLHPIVVIVGVLLGASVGGALGVILAAPVIASLRVIGQYLYGKLTDTPPFAPARPAPPPAPSLTQRLRGLMNRPTTRRLKRPAPRT